MNPVFRAAADANQLGWLTGIACVFFFALFVAFVVYWLLPRSKAELEAAAQLPLQED